LRGILFILQAQNLLSKKYQTPLIRDSTMALVIAAANSTPLINKTQAVAVIKQPIG
jgi:hypothetical protein